MHKNVELNTRSVLIKMVIWHVFFGCLRSFHSWRNDGICWQCSKKKKPAKIQSSEYGLQLCVACKQNHGASKDKYHVCNDTCVRYLLSMLTSAFRHRIRSMTVLPSFLSDLIANYVGADIVSLPFYQMHEMLFLRPKDTHCIKQNTGPCHVDMWGHANAKLRVL